MAKPKTASRGRTSSDPGIRANKKIRARVISGIRQAWTWYSPIRQSVVDAAMVRVKGPSGRMRNEYTCYDCKQSTLKYDVHHEPPVGSAPDWPPDGEGDWEAYMLRVDCEPKYLFLLCQTCHKARHHGDKDE